MKILVVDDDTDISEMLKSGLSSDSHTVEVAHTGLEGSFLARNYEYDAMVLDYSLPHKSGLALCQEIRAAGKTTPIIFLSVNDTTDIKVAALEMGADDYMTKPFSLEELRARLKAIARRPAPIQAHSVLSAGDVVLDTARQTVKRSGELIKLTKKEFGLLEYMMRNPGVILSRAMIMEHVWTADSDPFSNTVEAHIRNMRRKLNVGGKPNMVHNVSGRGYILEIPEDTRKK